MVKTVGLIFAISFVVIFSGCGPRLVTFAEKYEKEFAESLEIIQFYISEKVVLKREFQNEAREIVEGPYSLRIGHDKKIMEIIIPQHTPGILKKVEGDTLHIQFERGVNKTIPFRRFVFREDQPNNYVYRLDADTLEYGTDTYKVIYSTRDIRVRKEDVSSYAQSSEPHYIGEKIYPELMVDLVEERGRDKIRKKLSGVKVKDREGWRR